MRWKKFFLLVIPALILANVIFFAVQIFILKKGEQGALRVTANPESSVYLDGKFIGTTPLCRCPISNNMLQVGEYTLKIVPTSGTFNEYTEKIVIKKALLTVVDRTFNKGQSSEGYTITLDELPKKESAGLIVTSFPDFADVYIDKKLVGQTPLNLKNIVEGPHDLQIKKNGFNTKLIPLQINKGFNLLATVYLGIDSNALTPTVTPNLTNTPTPTASLSATPTKAKSTVSPTPSKTPTPSKSISPTRTPTPTLSSGKIEVINTPNGFLRVRQEPSTSSSEIARLKDGDIVNFIAKQNSWYEVQLSDGKTGWVSGAYVREL